MFTTVRLFINLSFSHLLANKWFITSARVFILNYCMGCLWKFRVCSSISWRLRFNAIDQSHAWVQFLLPLPLLFPPLPPFPLPLALEGSAEGNIVGDLVGALVGDEEGSSDGTADGVSVGTTDVVGKKETLGEIDGASEQKKDWKTTKNKS